MGGTAQPGEAVGIQISSEGANNTETVGGAEGVVVVQPKIPLFHGFPYKRKIVPADVGRQMPMRRHGFHRPWHLLQIASWVLFLVFYILVIVMLAPILPTPWDYVTYAFISASYVIMIWSNYKATTVDPVDPGTKHDEHTNLYEHDAVPSVKCGVCKAWIRTESKHCKPCNKCVCDFDHHCKWLNTCVGAANYVYFYTFLSITLVMSTVLGFVCVWIMIDTYHHSGKYPHLLDHYLNGMPLLNYRIAVMCILGLDLLAWGLLIELFKFHGVLSRRRLTTYEWIMASRKSHLLKSALAKARHAADEAAVEMQSCDHGQEDSIEEEEEETDIETPPPQPPQTQTEAQVGSAPIPHKEAPTEPLATPKEDAPDRPLTKLDLLKSPSVAQRRLPPLGTSL